MIRREEETIPGSPVLLFQVWMPARLSDLAREGVENIVDSGTLIGGDPIEPASIYLVRQDPHPWLRSWDQPLKVSVRR